MDKRGTGTSRKSDEELEVEAIRQLEAEDLEVRPGPGPRSQTSRAPSVRSEDRVRPDGGGYAPPGPDEIRIGERPSVKARGSVRERSTPQAQETATESKGSLAADKSGVKLLLDMVEGIMVSRVGEVARFTKAERDMIEPNAAKIMNSMSPKTVQKIGQFSAPIALVAGVFSYSMRIASSVKPPLAAPTPLRPMAVAPQTQPIRQETGGGFRVTPTPRANPAVDTNGHINGSVDSGLAAAKEMYVNG